MASLRQCTADVLMRPISDKELEAVDLDRFFEDHIETDLLHQFTDTAAENSSSDDLAHLFELSSSNDSDLFGTDSILGREADTWHEALKTCEQNPASPIPNEFSSLCIEPKAKESLSDSELLNFEEFFELERNQLRSISQPSTPRPHQARSVKKAVSFNERPVPRGVQKTLKKSASTSFTKMMQQPMYYRSPIPDVWSRKMEAGADAFQIRGPQNGITSPPLSSKLVQHENGNGFFSRDHQQPYTIAPTSSPSEEPQTPGIDFSNYQLTPQASPSIGVPNAGGNPFGDSMGLSFGSSAASSAALSALQTPPSSLRIPMTTWGTNSPNLDFDFSASPDFVGTGKTANWWNDETTARTTGFPTHRESNSRTTSQQMGLNNAAMNGLGISCDTTSFGAFTNVGLGVSGCETMTGTTTSSFDVNNYNAMYTTPQHHIVPIGHRPLSRSPSPSPQPRFHRRRPSSHSHASHTRLSHSSTASSRRKSSNSSSQSSRNPSSGSVGFVNFTPDDSRKILTGVAPSGSSKTKARREKEAAEKRRKLSQAAMKAVMEAGGDVDSLRRLEREGLLVLEN